MERELSVNPQSQLLKEAIRPEDALLLWCIREAPDRERTEQFNALIRKEVDWTKLLDASLQHGLVPLVYKSLESCNGESEKLSDFLLKMNLRNPSDRVRYFFGRSFVPAFEDWEWVSLPDSLYPLYYLIRPFRLALQYGPRLSNARKNSNP